MSVARSRCQRAAATHLDRILELAHELRAGARDDVRIDVGERDAEVLLTRERAHALGLVVDQLEELVERRAHALQARIRPARGGHVRRCVLSLVRVT